MDDATRLIELLERLGNLLRTERRTAAHTAGLQPVHFQALAYLARCNRYSNTPAAVTAWLGTTKGTASQSLGVLERGGLIRRRPDAKDRRVTRLALTRKGEHLLERLLPLPEWRECTRRLDADATRMAADALEALLRERQALHGGRSFGACHSCRHFRHEGEKRYRCGLTGEPLQQAEITLLCQEHEWPTGERMSA
jgi:MarR family transcriptional regulator, negative regulator of the multidrug operon emrRAB